MSSGNEILNKILNEYTITHALSKIFSGEYVSAKERKEAMKKASDIVANEEKAKKSSEKEKLRIDIQANAFKAFMKVLMKINFILLINLSKFYKTCLSKKVLLDISNYNLGRLTLVNV